MNHFSNKKFNLIKFGKGAIAVSSLALPALALPALISTTTNATVRNPRFVTTLSIRLGGITSSSSPSRNINTLRTTTTSSTGLSNSPTLKPNLTRDEYKKMVNINTGGPSSFINARIKDLYSSSTSTTSTTSNTPSLPIPKGNVAALTRIFASSTHSTTPSSSGSGKTSTPSGNVALLAKNFTSSSTSTTSSSGSRKTSTPSGTGNVTRIAKMFGN